MEYHNLTQQEFIELLNCLHRNPEAFITRTPRQKHRDEPIIGVVTDARLKALYCLVEDLRDALQGLEDPVVGDIRVRRLSTRMMQAAMQFFELLPELHPEVRGSELKATPELREDWLLVKVWDAQTDGFCELIDYVIKSRQCAKN